jgi:UrcA family protein
VKSVLFALATLSAISLAHASSAIDAPRTQEVSYADLDLNRPAGVEALYRRLSHAAKDVCYTHSATNSVGAHWQRAECAATAMANAVKQIGNSELTARFLRSVPHAAAMLVQIDDGQ